MPAVPDLSLRRVGHKGADHIAPGNTPASFDAALAADVHMIEFDVLPEDPDAPATTRLLLAHDYAHAGPDAVALEAGLAHLAAPAFADVELDVDLKLPGYEERVVAALREHGLVERTLVSTLFMRSLVKLRALEPRLRLGWSVPRVRRDYAAHWYTAGPAYVLRAARAPPSAPDRRRASRGRALRRADGALAARDPAAGRGGRRGGRRPLRVDRRRRRADPPARGARGHGRDHERPAAVRSGYAISHVAELKSAGSAPAVPGWPASVTALSRRSTSSPRRHS